MTAMADDACHTREAAVLAALKAGDEAAFAALVDEHTPLMLRLARACVPTPSVAEEVVQEAWTGFIVGLARFEGRCSLKTWLLRIVVNQARRRGERERRCVAFSSLGDDSFAATLDNMTADARGASPVWAGGSPFVSPQDQVIGAETLARLGIEIDALPDRQRDVIVLRDVEGWSANEVCTTLGVTDANQRVLLHRARRRVGRALLPYLVQREPGAEWSRAAAV
jgi:RNA polymerase sigma-70 factor (ECF subfamily)